MNENLNLVEILKDCPKGTKLYSTVYGEVEFEEIGNGGFPVKYVKSDDSLEGFHRRGRFSRQHEPFHGIREVQQ